MHKLNISPFRRLLLFKSILQKLEEEKMGAISFCFSNQHFLHFGPKSKVTSLWFTLVHLPLFVNFESHSVESPAFIPPLTKWELGGGEIDPGLNRGGAN